MEFLPKSPAEVLSRIDSTRRPRPELDVPYVAARDATEQMLANCWAEVLGLKEVGVDDNFFNLGGDSIHMAQIASLLRERCGVEVGFGKFFDHPTVASLAQVIRQPG